VNAKILPKTCVLLFMGISCASAGTMIPDTLAGSVLRAWLSAFNSGNPSLITRDVLPLNPYQSLNDVVAFRKATGGFDLLAIERSEPMHIWFLVKDKNTSRQAIGDLWVKSTAPLETRYFGVFLLPPDVSPVIVTLDSALRGRVINGVAADLRKFYIHPAVASQMIAALQAHQKAGTYRDLKDGFQFADRLTSDLRAVSHDGHLFVRFQPYKAPPPTPPTVQQIAQLNEQIELSNCGFEKVEVLPGDIGYVKFNAFMLPGVCAGTIEAAMTFVAHARALILDLRDNHGGAPVTVAFIASYLFDRPTQLSSIYRRDQNTTNQFWTLPSLPGERLSTQPVFVLTSNRTFSGAEQFTYDLKNLKRATIVGEPTGGGAHTVNGYLVADYFLVQVPIGEAINPITHTNWEGTGVQPDVKVPAAEALNVAERCVFRRS
jgi:Peptidase family S41/N-terminal domain of Peptidase_S41 in eukaryotic IRBP